MYSCGIFWLLPPMALFIAMTIYTLEHVNTRYWLVLYYCLSKSDSFHNLQCEFDPVTVGFSIICVMVGLLWTATFCNYATHGIDHIENIGFAAYNLKWYDSPFIFRKYIILIIARSQEEIHFTGWGMIYCNLEALGTVSFSMGDLCNFTIIPVLFSYTDHQFCDFILFDLSGIKSNVIARFSMKSDELSVIWTWNSNGVRSEAVFFYWLSLNLVIMFVASRADGMVCRRSKFVFGTKFCHIFALNYNFHIKNVLMKKKCTLCK